MASEAESSVKVLATRPGKNSGNPLSRDLLDSRLKAAKRTLGAHRRTRQGQYLNNGHAFLVYARVILARDRKSDFESAAELSRE